MSRSVITVEGLSKEYVIGGRENARETFREMLLSAAAAPFRRFRTLSGGAAPEDRIWALRDVSFDVKEGEVVGIIGRNGAGKSTLLKILSRITEPTRGHIEIRGRVASLLEVGTGFHQELTGRENIYLNGAILGMSRAEIKSKFDMIVDFSGVEKFMDTPVKRYSSGMYMRLAFAVAAHLDPEILVVDEILAVGDIGFQKKCLTKMSDLRDTGRTVIFVSHNLQAISTLCQSGILLSEGRIERAGPISDVIGHYLQGQTLDQSFVDLTLSERSGSGDARFRSIQLHKHNVSSQVFTLGEALSIRLTVDIYKNIGPALVAILIASEDGFAIHELLNINEEFEMKDSCGTTTFDVTIPEVRLYPGTYYVDLWLADRSSFRLDYIRTAAAFHVVQPSNGKFLRLHRSNGIVVQHSVWVTNTLSKELGSVIQTGD